MVNYTDSDNYGSFSMYYISRENMDNWRKSELFSKHLSTKFNDGPATFNSAGNIIYYSRNMFTSGSVKKNLTSLNKLGIFTATLREGVWNSISEYRLNSDYYNITTPCLSPDGQRLYFASDRPDGYGGADLYYSQLKDGYWEDPVNLGPEINTSGNESYPFINEVGELFFSSDGHPGLGGKDIFVTKQIENGWYPPQRLDSPINSKYNDFGIVTDTLMHMGYFSSDRDKTVDIYSFQSERYPVWFSVPQSRNNYCLSITDTGIIEIDTLKLQYEWDFGDNKRINGSVVDYCFAGPGDYDVKVHLIENSTGDLYFHKSTLKITIRDKEQPFINSPDLVLVGETVDLDGLSSYSPGYDIADYFWEFGDSTYGYGSLVSHSFDRPGVYTVKLGLTLRSNETGKFIKSAVSKQVRVFENENERRLYIADSEGKTEVEDYDNFVIHDSFSAERDILGEAVFRLELMQSDRKVEPTSIQFGNISEEFRIKERFIEETNKYSYTLGQSEDLMSLYLIYQKIKSSGFQDARVVLDVLTDPADIELNRLLKRYGNLTDEYFNSSNGLVTNGILMLNQIAGLLQGHPEIKIEVGVHTDNIGTLSSNNLKSQNMAQTIVDYLVGTGVNRTRLTAKGFGELYPVRSNMFAAERKLNRRIEFIIYK